MLDLFLHDHCLVENTEHKTSKAGDEGALHLFYIHRRFKANRNKLGGDYRGVGADDSSIFVRMV